MAQYIDVQRAARELAVAPSRVRALIADGALDAEKIGGRWLVDRDSVVRRRGAGASSGRPLTARNAWALLIAASGEAMPDTIGPHARWRIRQTLEHHRLEDLRSRLERRATTHRLWTLPGEMRALRAEPALALTGSSASGTLHLELAAPDTLDAYLPASGIQKIMSAYGLEPATTARATVILRAVPDEAWFLNGRVVASSAAAGLDLLGYPDPRSTRVGRDLLTHLDVKRRR